MLDFRWRNDGPIAVTADFAGNPITVLNPGLCRRTVLGVATWHGAPVRHHPGGIKPLMDGLIFRWMVMLLRYGGAGGENEAAPGHTSIRTRKTGGETPTSHGGPAKNAQTDARNLNTLRDEGHRKHQYSSCASVRSLLRVITGNTPMESGHEKIMRKDRFDAGVDGPLKAFSYSTLALAFESARAFDVLERALRWYRGRTLQCHFKVRSVH
jgi:hypothetical protein